MANYIVIGADGFIGSTLMQRLTNLGDFVVGFGLNYVDREDYYRIDYLNDNWRDVFHNALQNYNIQFNGLVFSAGLMTHDSIHNLTIREWSKTLDVNQTAFIFSVKDSLQYLTPDAAIVGIASQNGIVGHEDRISYGATKAAMIQLIKDIQVDLATNGFNKMRINAVSPGYIWREEFLKIKNIDTLKNKTLTGDFVSVEQVVSVINFLLNDQSSGILGQNIVVDNGYTVI